MTAQIIGAYVATLFALAIGDALWLGVIAKGFVKAQLGVLLRDEFVWWAAVLFYLFFALGLFYFAVLPGLTGAGVLRVFLLGAFLGFLAYMTYDFTNLATLKGWPILLVPVDIAWGSLLSGAAAVVGLFAGRALA